MIEFVKQNFSRVLNILVKNKTYELEDIKFFDEKGVIVNIGRYFDSDIIPKNFEGSVVRKLKIDLDYKDNFIVKSEQYNGYDLYIYKGNVDLKFLGREQKYFGNIYTLWEVNDIKFDRYEKNITKILESYNKEAKEILQNLTEYFGYNDRGIKDTELNEKLDRIKELNNLIKQESTDIALYELDNNYREF